MSRMLWVTLGCWLFGAALGCGEESQFLEGNDSLSRGEVARVPVVFRVDYPDIYGPIDVQIRGAGSLTLEADDRFSCDQPTFVHEGGALEFGALSSRYFFWRDVVISDEGVECLIVDLSIERLHTYVLAYGIDFPYFCYPYTVSFKFGPHEVREGLWTIGGQQRLHVDALVERTVEHGFLALVDEARKGRLILMGGGYALVEPTLHIQSVGSPTACPEVLDGKLTGFAPLTLVIFHG